MAKILANRLKGVLHGVIGEEQSTFLSGRSMMDTILVENELIHDARSKNEQLMVFKEDFEKAYDSVRWDYLVYMMRRMNFQDRWVRWIEVCLRSERVSILVNGSLTEEFRMERGLRQGDPLASFLFLIAAKELNGLLQQAMRLEKYVGYALRGNIEVKVSISQFADDTLLFGRQRFKMLS